MSDLINRQNAIDVLEILADKMSDAGKTVMAQAVAVLKDLQSAEPEQRKGKWIEDEHTYSGPNTYNYVCSACGAIGGSWLRGLPKNLMYPFCPFCGADMRGE